MISYELLDKLAFALFECCSFLSLTSPRSQNSVSYTNIQANYFVLAHKRSHFGFVDIHQSEQIKTSKSHSLGEQLPPCNRNVQSLHINIWNKRTLPKKSIKEIQIVAMIEEIKGFFQEFHEPRQKYPTFI